MSTPGIGHNISPVTAPTDEQMLADLRSRYPAVQAELDAFEKALKTYPEKLTLEDEETAAALQDLLGKMAKQKRHWASDRKDEKGPWDKLVKVVMNFFGTAEDKIDGYLEIWKPRHQAFLDLKATDARRKAEEAAEAQRAESERLRKEAEAAEQRRQEAERAEAEARRREEEARQRAAAAEQERIASEARAAAAAAEEKRLAEERRIREKAEKEANTANLREIRRLMKDAEKLNLLAEADEADETEVKQLDDLISVGKTIGNLASSVANSILLDDLQKPEIEAFRQRLGELRVAFNRRVDAKERKRREKARLEAEAREQAAADARRADRERQEAQAAAHRAEREAADGAAQAAREAQQAAKKDAREARTEANEAFAEQKGAAKDIKAASTDADRAENRADRLDRRVENSTDADFSRTRGELGTTGSLSGRWHYNITNERALRAVSGPLGEHLTTDALEGAVYRWMVAHREGFDGERVEGALPGVIFSWERETRIA